MKLNLPWRIPGFQVLMADMINVLSEFEEATTIVSGQRYVTLSLILPIATHLSGTMAAVCSTTQKASGKKLAKTLRKELQKKFPIQRYDPTSAAAICTALDPHFQDLTFPEQTDKDVVRDTMFIKANTMYKPEQPATRHAATEL